MSHIHEMFGVPQLVASNSNSRKILRSDILMGIELEVEGLPKVDTTKSCITNTTPEMFADWKIVGDGSLRNNGIEFVMKKPRNGNHLLMAINALDIALRTTVFPKSRKPNYNWRTSLHVHVNVSDRTIQSVINEIITYLLFEPLLINYCGFERDNNIFCVPFYKNNILVEKLSLFRTTNQLHFSEDNKYCALNLGAISKYGSIEYRTHQGTHNAEEILQWVNIIGEIRTASENLRGTGDLYDLPSLISSQGLLEFGRSCFPFSWEHLTRNYSTKRDLKKDILKGVRIAQDVLFTPFQ